MTRTTGSRPRRATAAVDRGRGPALGQLGLHHPARVPRSKRCRCTALRRRSRRHRPDGRRHRRRAVAAGCRRRRPGRPHRRGLGPVGPRRPAPPLVPPTGRLVGADRRPALLRPVHRRLSAPGRPHRVDGSARVGTGRVSLAGWISRPLPSTSSWVRPVPGAAARRGRCARPARPRSSRAPRSCAPVHCRSPRRVSTPACCAWRSWPGRRRAARRCSARSRTCSPRRSSR